MGASTQKWTEEALKRRKEQYEVAAYFAQEMIAELGEERALEIVKRAFARKMVDDTNRRLEGVPLEERFARFSEQIQQQARDNPATIRMLEASPTRLALDITWCGTLEYFRSMGIGEMCRGYCLSSFAGATAIHPRVRFEQVHRIIDGEDHCDHVWVYEE